MTLSKRTQLHLVAMAILLAGVGSGGLMYWRAATSAQASSNRDPEDQWSDPSLSLTDSKSQTRELEMYSGKMGVLIYRFEGFLSDWMQPKPLGLTIVVVSVAAAYGTYVIGKMTPST